MILRKSLSVTAKTALVSSLFAIMFLSIGGFALDNVLQTIAENSAESTLRSELSALASTIEALTPENATDPLDPLPPGQLAVVRNPSGLTLLNSFSKFSIVSQTPLRALPVSKVETFQINGQEYWGIRQYVPGPNGLWEVVVSQSNQLNKLFSHQVIYLLLSFGGILIVVIWLGSLLLANFVLHPVKEMRIRAEELIKNQERGSLPVSTADDEISNLARTLNQLLEALHASLSQQSQLIADVSHELRTPLAVLQSRLQLAINSEERSEHRLELAKMLESSMSLTNMLNQILFLARNSPSANNQISTATEMRELFFNTIDSMRLLASKRSIVIEGSVEVEHSAQISIDGLERILNNLIANSLASVEAGGTITVDVSQTECVTKLVVRDSGVGFPPDFIPKALERFSRADSSRSRETGGFGLGLSLVKAILDSCDGDIEIENLPDGQGAKISLTLKNVTVSPHRN